MRKVSYNGVGRNVGDDVSVSPAHQFKHNMLTDSIFCRVTTARTYADAVMSFFFSLLQGLILGETLCTFSRFVLLPSAYLTRC